MIDKFSNKKIDLVNEIRNLVKELNIRYKMGAIFIPHVFNDNRYGGDKILKGTVYTKYKQFVDNCFKLLPRQALHAKTLGFIHPKSNEKISFDSEIPDDMNSVINKWRLYSKHKNL